MTVTRSPGLPTGYMGLVAGGGVTGATWELDSTVRAAAEALGMAYPGRDVTIRFNSNRLSGGAWIVTHPVDGYGRNAEVGVCAELRPDRAEVEAIWDETNLDPAAIRRRVAALPRSVRINAHVGTTSRRDKIAEPAWPDMDSIEAAIAWLQANAVLRDRYD